MAGAGGTAGAPGQLSFSWSFDAGAQGWTADFSDYSTVMTDLELGSGIEALPADIDASRDGFMIQGHNRSDDLFMYLAKELGAGDGIAPDTRYQADFVVRFASNAGTGCVGIGGAPGESVFFKVGVAPLAPVPVLMADFYQLSADKGAQNNSGDHATLAGNVANGIPCDQPAQYVTLERTQTHAVNQTSTADAKLWLFVGTDSGFEGLTRLYYESVAVTLTPE